MHLTIIGISDQENPSFSDELLQQIENGVWFAGGKRHYKRVAHLLPRAAKWHDVVVPLSSLFQSVETSNGNWIVFASGDPLFFGIANTLKRAFPEAEIAVFPYFNSLQLLAHRRGISYGEAAIVTLTGRPWNKFDAALMEGNSLIALLTDRSKTPSAIASRMLKYGYTNYKMVVGENLGGADEIIQNLSLDEAQITNFSFPNCLYLQKISERKRYQGIPDRELEGLPNRPKMMTKLPIRLATLALMQLGDKKVFWDVGTCTGSIAIEAKLQWPLLEVLAFEKREESRGIVERNCIKFGVPGVDFHEGDFLTVDKTLFQLPDVVFMGGYGGEMALVLDEVNRCLLPNGILCFNAVSAISRDKFKQWGVENGYTLESEMHIQVDDFNPITILVLTKLECKE